MSGLSGIGDRLARRAYALMAAAERDFGHRSAAHIVAWTALVEAGNYRDGGGILESAAFDGLGELSTSLDLVAAALKKATPELVEKLTALAQRPQMMAKIIGPCPHCHGSGQL